MRLLGVDVGFSKTRRTTGIALVDGDRVLVYRARSDWPDRASRLRGFQPELIAVDGPLVPSGSQGEARGCELAFVRAPFHNRCKPGLSHWGRGLYLRVAAAETCGQLRQILPPEVSQCPEVVTRNGPVIEAFPNAFLGVLAPDELFRSVHTLKRGKRFDWLYDNVAKCGQVEAKLYSFVDLPRDFWRKLATERGHEERAALICLLTAALAYHHSATVIGDSLGGWFWLPPIGTWESWAREGLSAVAGDMAANHQPIQVDNPH